MAADRHLPADGWRVRVAAGLGLLSVRFMSWGVRLSALASDLGRCVLHRERLSDVRKRRTFR